MMDIRRQLESLPSDYIIEASYLVGRYLTHTINDHAFESMFLADDPSGARRASYAIALDIVRAIEKDEGRPLRELSRTSRQKYILELSEAVRTLATPLPDPRMIEDMQIELEHLHL